MKCALDLIKEIDKRKNNTQWIDWYAKCNVCLEDKNNFDRLIEIAHTMGKLSAIKEAETFAKRILLDDPKEVLKEMGVETDED